MKNEYKVSEYGVFIEFKFYKTQRKSLSTMAETSME